MPGREQVKKGIGLLLRRSVSSRIALRCLSHPWLYVWSAKDYSGEETTLRGTGPWGHTLDPLSIPYILGFKSGSWLATYYSFISHCTLKKCSAYSRFSIAFWTGQREIVKWSEVAQSCPTLCDPMDCSLPGFSVHGIFQARVLEWAAISFSVKQLTFS